MSAELQPGPELDRMVAERVMGWRVVNPGDDWMDGPFPFYSPADAVPSGMVRRELERLDYWQPSIDWAAAGEVVERMIGLGYGFTLDRAPGQDPPRCCEAAFYRRDMLGDDGNCWGDSGPHAICLAALKTLGFSTEAVA